MNKTELRKKYREKRKNRTPQEKASLDLQLQEQALKQRIFMEYDCILLYASLPAEPATELFAKELLRQGKRIAFPICYSEGKMEFYEVLQYEELHVQEHQYGILVPYEIETRKITEFDHTICLVPGFCFQKEGFRLGYGGGYYDRFLQKHPEITTIGYTYSDCIESNIPTEETDQRVSYVLTEQGII